MQVLPQAGHAVHEDLPDQVNIQLFVLPNPFVSFMNKISLKTEQNEIFWAMGIVYL